MPLRAALHGTDIHAFRYTEENWSALRAAPERALLVMPCCGERAIPKTSALGSKFFSHYRKPIDCDSAPESKEHILLKEIASKAALAAGWNVTTEYAGASSDGTHWIADVFCTKNKARIALEIQLSKQSASQFSYRQNRYKDSGVRAAWFTSERILSSLLYTSSKSLPIFAVGNLSEPSLSPEMTGFGVTFYDFVKDLLSGKVTWQEDPNEVQVHYINDSCWNCKKHVKQAYGWSIDVYSEYVKTVPNCSTVLLELSTIVSNQELSSRGINQIFSRPHFKGNAPSFPYCAICLHCGQPQANCYLMEKLTTHRHESAMFGSETFVIGTCNGRWEHRK